MITHHASPPAVQDWDVAATIHKLLKLAPRRQNLGAHGKFERDRVIEVGELAHERGSCRIGSHPRIKRRRRIENTGRLHTGENLLPAMLQGAGRQICNTGKLRVRARNAQHDFAQRGFLEYPAARPIAIDRAQLAPCREFLQQERARDIEPVQAFHTQPRLLRIDGKVACARERRQLLREPGSSTQPFDLPLKMNLERQEVANIVERILDLLRRQRSD